MAVDGREWFSALLPKQKGLVVRGRNPAGKLFLTKEMDSSFNPALETINFEPETWHIILASLFHSGIQILFERPQVGQDSSPQSTSYGRV